MIKKDSFGSEWIFRISREKSADPSIIERMIYAFALLESLKQTKLNFIFKGGTCLSLLIKDFNRFSVDIDIQTGEDQGAFNLAMEFLKNNRQIFSSMEENFRKPSGKLVKRHFKFQYNSQVSGKTESVLLDVVFEKSLFRNLNETQINHWMLVVEPPVLTVTVPSLPELLMDKLTAFAPKTIGILYGRGKSIEIIKQMHDVAELSRLVGQDDLPLEVYQGMALKQISDRELEIDFQKTLEDSILACLSIISEGGYESQNYPELKQGIRGFRSYVLGQKFTSIDAVSAAIDVLYVASVLRVFGIQNFQQLCSPSVDFFGEPFLKNVNRRLRSEQSASGNYKKLVDAFSVLRNQGII